jgi:hypothetical protein
LAIFLLFISPTILTLSWHVVHGNSVEFRGHALPVPFSWTADQEGQMWVSMTKYPATLIHGVQFKATVSFSPVLPDPEANPQTDYSLWEKVFWNTALTGQAVKGPVRIGSGRHEAICMEAADTNGAGPESARCLTLNGSWQADFLGDASDMNTFLDMVRDFN